MNNLTSILLSNSLLPLRILWALRQGQRIDTDALNSLFHTSEGELLLAVVRLTQYDLIESTRSGICCTKKGQEVAEQISACLEIAFDEL